MASRPCITIVGTGLIGTSMGMAVLQARGKEIDVLGHDIDFGQARLAQRMGGVTRAERNLISACSQADMIILAIPTMAIRETLQLIANDLKSGCVVTDVAGLKVPTLEWADELLPREVSYVGGDPILFGDEAGIDSARADLLKGAYYCIAPSMRASSDSIKLVSDLVAMVGAIPHFIDPHEHDGLIGGTEHLADIVAVTLLGSLTRSDGWRDMRKMCGATFDRVTCFSQADPAEYSSRALLNKENILRWIDSFTREMWDFRRLIETEDTGGLEKYYQAEMNARLQWLKDRESKDWGDMPKKGDVPTSGDFMSQMLFGGFARRKTEE
jgi:prephenate dehydrogenase